MATKKTHLKMIPVSVHPKQLQQRRFSVSTPPPCSFSLRGPTSLASIWPWREGLKMLALHHLSTHKARLNSHKSRVCTPQGQVAEDVEEPWLQTLVLTLSRWDTSYCRNCWGSHVFASSPFVHVKLGVNLLQNQRYRVVEALGLQVSTCFWSVPYWCETVAAMPSSSPFSFYPWNEKGLKQPNTIRYTHNSNIGTPRTQMTHILEDLTHQMVPVNPPKRGQLGSRPPKLNIALEKWWLEDDPFLLGR